MMTHTISNAGRVSAILTLAASLFAVPPAAAQTYSVLVHLIAGGGSHSTGGTFALTGSTGQPADPVVPVAGGTFSLFAGFWPAADAARVPFSDPVLIPGASVVRALHVIELRQRIDGLRVRFGLGVFPWTDGVITPGVTAIRSVHYLELRDGLSQAYTAAGRTPPTFLAPAGAGALITAAGTIELREAVFALE